MPRLASVAVLAIALLGGCSMALITRATHPFSRRSRSHDVAAAPTEPVEEAPAAVPAPAPAARPALASAPVAASRAPGPPASGAAPAAPPPETRRPSRTLRHFLRAKQVREQLAARRDGDRMGPGLLTEEPASMEDQGFDWRRIERALEAAEDLAR